MAIEGNLYVGSKGVHNMGLLIIIFLPLTSRISIKLRSSHPTMYDAYTEYVGNMRAW